MDKAIAGIAKVLKESEQSLGASLLKTLDVLSNHEQRLQKLEGLENGHLIDSLENLAQRIEAMSDPAKRERAREAFVLLCGLFGVEPPEHEDADKPDEESEDLIIGGEK